MLEHLGPVIRNLRREKGLTLVEIAAKTGIAQATLSRIETGVMIGTVESHAKIAEVLGVPLAELYLEPGAAPFTEHSTAKKTVHQGKNIQRELLTAEHPPKKMTPVLTVLQAGAETPCEQAPKGTEKFIYLLEGKISVSAGSETFTLSQGETLYFDAAAGHQVKNAGTSPAQFLSVTCSTK